jgi:hypothetical protein
VVAICSGSAGTLRFWLKFFFFTAELRNFIGI